MEREASAEREGLAERLWRVRKEHAWIDARLRTDSGTGDVELQGWNTHW